jgi:N-acetylglutamate synthase-like GNAT family acetyltransferase
MEIKQNFLIRNASHKDLLKLISLVEQFGYPIQKQDLLQNIELFLHAPYKAIWVAEKKGKVVGCLAIDLINLFHTKEKLARIVTLVVDEKERKQGIARKLVEKAEEFAKSMHCSVVELTTGISKKKMDDFYKKLHYTEKEKKIYFTKDL